MLKKAFWRDNRTVFIVGLVLSAGYAFMIRRPGLLFNLANFTFCVGIFNLVIAGCNFVRNMGLFKSLGYMAHKGYFKLVGYTAFRRSFHRYGEAEHRTKPMSFAEYNSARKMQPIKEYLIIGAPLAVLSYVLAVAAL